MPDFLVNKGGSWLVPQEVYKEITGGIRVGFMKLYYLKNFSHNN